VTVPGTPVDGSVLLGVWTEEELEAIHPGGSILGVEQGAAYPAHAAAYVRAALVRSLVVRGDLVAQDGPSPFPAGPGPEADGDGEVDEADEGAAYAWSDDDSLVVSPDSPLALVLLARTSADRAVVVEVRTPGWTSAMGYLGGGDSPWLEEAKLPGAVRRFALHRLDGLVAGLIDELGLQPDGEPQADAGGLRLTRDDDGRLSGEGGDEVAATVDAALHLVTVETAELPEGAGDQPAVRVVVAHAAERPPWLLFGPPGPGPVLALPAAGLDHARWLRAAFASGLSEGLFAPV
jgi:hypothetical protein